ncbi:MAG: MogA/MoaB family molybdenum cofactor biosynthesis protein [Methanocalculus sp. MSAO_Arc1]|uniref:MogA/MoaB family molybdenum cofactor biosynthesis protein n=1 Tax=Methanocalculus TaxID=71151 RepID=UPI000FF5BAF3|nr:MULTISPECIES: MogA/MoaB family molybdenum cofactor biosynthesis protein [unclassified Methanocalculus]MCP1661645.1 molybdenum cofactor biosynthesis protein B [Methanocalculus sp. AMF5]RQD81908.1 MAG: MogA/MoaB family molybdenum cofactor biosynthesis protein [Methanocalculus sp. MSAO_Arc1]
MSHDQHEAGHHHHTNQAGTPTDRVPIRAAVITVSTTRTRTDDRSGRTATDLLAAAGIGVVFYRIVADREDAIQAALQEALTEADCIILNGGTGLTPDDCTIEAVKPLLEKEMPGFGELFRQKSIAEVGTAVILSRATAGIISGRAIFCIPGSTKAVRLAVEDIIIPEIRHILAHAAPRRES